MRERSTTIEGRGRNVWQAATRHSSFNELLHEHCKAMASDFGISVEINERALVTAFFGWAQIVENHAADPRRKTPDYFQFLVGSLLARLLAAHAIDAVPGIEGEQTARNGNAIAKWWPTGFDDIKIWQSFRENLIEEPSIAIAYFDDFMGSSPNWHNPSVFRERAAAQR
jgi:hypothetical protein